MAGWDDSGFPPDGGGAVGTGTAERTLHRFPARQLTTLLISDKPYEPYEPYEPNGPYGPYEPNGPYGPYEPNGPYGPYEPNGPYEPYNSVLELLERFWKYML